MGQEKKPWVSFCMSTYKRTEFLKIQIASLLYQTFKDFEIVIADNDPEASGLTITNEFNDSRIKYQCNGDNIGMINSYNKCIERSLGQYLVMVTDDDPVEKDFLSVFNAIVFQYPGFSLYGGLTRKSTDVGVVEIIEKDRFINEFLDLRKTTNILWSSCLLEKTALLQIGMLPNYGSPHLVDHAMLALIGSINGAVVVNKMYSHIVLHKTNFSKSNFEFYFVSCERFYQLLNGCITGKPFNQENKKVIIDHLGRWFMSSIFNLLNYYKSHCSHNKKNFNEVKAVGEKILQLPFMNTYYFRYKLKLFVLEVKYAVGIKK